MKNEQIKNPTHSAYGFYIALPPTVEIPEGEAIEKAEVCITHVGQKRLMTYEEFLSLIFKQP